MSGNGHQYVPLNKLPDEPRPQPDRAPEDRWRDDLIMGEKAPRAVLANAITALRHAPAWAGVLAYDEMAFSPVARGSLPWEDSLFSSKERRLSDRDDTLTANWLQHHGIMVNEKVAHTAIETVAQDRPFHPVCEYLEGLKWDGQPRVDTWLSYYCGVARCEYADAVGVRWLISAVARALRPGCKADHMLIFEGAQRKGKSSAAGILGGAWFSDDLGDLGNKDSAMQAGASWIIEVAELDALSRAEVVRVKAYLTRKVDKFRPPYGRRLIEAPRQCIFVGTTNQDDYLRDETGGRRFWPVKAESIDLEALARDRDQLWAEAVHLFKQGRSWWLENEHLESLAADEQSARYAGDPWTDAVEKFVAAIHDVSISDILIHLDIPRVQWTQREQNRVARILRAAGYERYQRWHAGGRREWRYRDPHALSSGESGEEKPEPNQQSHQLDF